jgi:hypothetical protein
VHPAQPQPPDPRPAAKRGFECPPEGPTVDRVGGRRRRTRSGEEGHGPFDRGRAHTHAAKAGSGDFDAPQEWTSKDADDYFVDFHWTSGSNSVFFEINRVQVRAV